MRPLTLIWSGGEDDFALTIDLGLALQDRCGGDGVGLIYERLSAGVPGLRDVIDTIALGLEGGGMSRTEANRKTRTELESVGVLGLAQTAQAVLGTLLMGYPDQGEAPAEAESEHPST